MKSIQKNRSAAIWMTVCLIFCLTVQACTMEKQSPDRAAPQEAMPRPVRLKLLPRPLQTRAIEPEDFQITDLNLFIFNEAHCLEKHLFLDRHDLASGRKEVSFRVQLLAGVRYHIRAAANVGYRILNINNLEELDAFRYHLAYPDEFHAGLPMTGSHEVELPIWEDSGKETEINIVMERLAAKISVRMDRRELDRDVRLRVKSISVRRAPRSARMFRPSKALNELDVFRNGYRMEYGQADGLNRESMPGISQEVSLYLLENKLGNLLPRAEKPEDKVLGDVPEAEIASYLELELDYQSEKYSSAPEEYLIYRFYLGEGPKNFDIERNCHYHYTLCPKGDGLGEISWRVDKSRLTPLAETPFTLHPSTYIEAKVGEELHVWAELKDKTAKFDVGLEELDYEKGRGMFDYQIDPDGKGVRLHLRKKGTAILYMSSGSYTEMAFIVINP